MSADEGQFCENALLAVRQRSDKQSKIRSTTSDFTTKFGVLLQIFTPDRAVWQTHNIVPQGLIYLGIAPVPALALGTLCLVHRTGLSIICTPPVRLLSHLAARGASLLTPANHGDSRGLTKK